MESARSRGALPAEDKRRSWSRIVQASLAWATGSTCVWRCATRQTMLNCWPRWWLSTRLARVPLVWRYARDDGPDRRARFATVDCSAPGERLALHRREEPNGSRSPQDTADYAELRQLVTASRPAGAAARVLRGEIHWHGIDAGHRPAGPGARCEFASLGTGSERRLPGVRFGQIGLLGHDVAHRQVFRSARLASLFGLVLGNLLLGIGMGWWRESHNGAHHNNPNHFDLDPNIDFYVLAFTPEQGRRNRPCSSGSSATRPSSSRCSPASRS